MKRKFAVVGALLALALALVVPSSSMAAVGPAGHKFAIASGSTLKTSLGSCTLGGFTGQVPAGEASSFAINPPTVSSCASGTSLSFSAGEWIFSGGGSNHVVSIREVNEGATMKFASLPGCKLVGKVNLLGLWANGRTLGPSQQSVFLPDRRQTLTWANDGAACALAGSTELVSWESEWETIEGSVPKALAVTDLTNLSEFIDVH